VRARGVRMLYVHACLYMHSVCARMRVRMCLRMPLNMGIILAYVHLASQSFRS